MENHGLRLSFRAGVCHRLFRWPTASRLRRPQRGETGAWSCQPVDPRGPSLAAKLAAGRSRVAKRQPPRQGTGSPVFSQRAAERAVFMRHKRYFRLFGAPVALLAAAGRRTGSVGRLMRGTVRPPGIRSTDLQAFSCSAFPLGWALVGGAPDGGALRGPFGGPAGAVAKRCSLIRGHLPPDGSPGASDSPAGG